MVDYSIPNIITVGSKNYPLYRFDNSAIVSGSISGVFSVDTIGDELSIDTFRFTVRYDPTAADQIYAPVGKDGYKLTDGAVYALTTAEGRAYMRELPYGTPVYWYCDGDFMCKAYLESVERIGTYAWTISCTSGVGLLANSSHAGGVYTGQTVAEVAAEIIGDSFPFTVDEDAGSVTVLGWLPYDTRRANLHKLLFATGASLLRGDINTDYRIGFIKETSEPADIGADRVSVTGKSSFPMPATAVEVIEHSYYQSPLDQDEQLYDNTNGVAAVNLTVKFDSPHYDYETTGSLTVIESGVNYAVVSGVGVLTGKHYSHTTILIREGTDTRLTKRVNDTNCLISSLNSRSVAQRALSFFSSAETIESRLLLQSERCGLQFNVTDSFGETAKAFLKQIVVNPTALKAATCTFIEGYTPTGQGNFYNNRVLITADGTWTVPAGVQRIRVVLVGGGAGGDGGLDGANGQTPDDRYYIEDDPEQYIGTQGWRYSPEVQSEPLGGSGGAGGTQGRIVTADVTVSEGLVLSFSIGSGGSGGAANGGTGSAGTDTTVTSAVFNATSADGSVMPAFVDPITQEMFAFAGATGIKGGNGGMTDTFDLESYRGGDGFDGEDVGENLGGSGGTGKINEDVGVPPQYGTYYYDGSGGGAGGAAFGANGSDGSQASVTIIGDPPVIAVQFANGGNGADAAAPAAVTYGCGGNGGHGGGAGGNAAGGGLHTLYGGTNIGTGGTGGNGSAGGAGGNGAVFIYY